MFNIQFEVGNAAFADGFSDEVERILSNIAQKVKQGQTQGIIKDTNGNCIGHWSW